MNPILSEEEMIAHALKEDIPQGDITTGSLQKPTHMGTASLIAKQDLVISGSTLFKKTVEAVDSRIQSQWKFQDGDSVLKGQTVCDLQGNLIELLKAERVALNFLGPLSGIATLTQKFVKACEGTKTKILDTRKTRPLYRTLEKQAALHGGGHNHRMNLSDAVLIKENHIFVGEGLEKTVAAIQKASGLSIEVEVKNFQEIERACKLPVQRLMFDNMTNDQIERALKIVPEGIEVEASGNMTLERTPSVAALGVDYISVGALTHSAPNADFSLLFRW